VIGTEAEAIDTSLNSVAAQAISY